MSDLILYTSVDGRVRLHLRMEGETVWLTQLEVAELFQTTKNNISIHTKNIFADEELSREATIKESLIVQAEGRQVRRRDHRVVKDSLTTAVDMKRYRTKLPKLWGR